jgi:ABC-type polysaccharide/polyol phosphate export permease
MSDWMKTVTMLNPLIYIVHAVRYRLTGANVGLVPEARGEKEEEG